MSVALMLDARMGSSYGLDVRFCPLCMCSVACPTSTWFVIQGNVLLTWPGVQPIRPGLCVHDGSKKHIAGTY